MWHLRLTHYWHRDWALKIIFKNVLTKFKYHPSVHAIVYKYLEYGIVFTIFTVHVFHVIYALLIHICSVTSIEQLSLSVRGWLGLIVGRRLLRVDYKIYNKPVLTRKLKIVSWIVIYNKKKMEIMKTKARTYSVIEESRG